MSVLWQLQKRLFKLFPNLPLVGQTLPMCQIGWDTQINRAMFFRGILNCIPGSKKIGPKKAVTGAVPFLCTLFIGLQRVENFCKHSKKFRFFATLLISTPTAGVGNVDPGGPVSLQSLAPTLIKHT